MLSSCKLYVNHEVAAADRPGRVSPRNVIFSLNRRGNRGKTLGRLGGGRVRSLPNTQAR